MECTKMEPKVRIVYIFYIYILFLQSDGKGGGGDAQVNSPGYSRFSFCTAFKILPEYAVWWI